MTTGLAEDSFTSAVAGTTIAVNKDMNISVDFTTGSGVGTVVLERSFDGGATFKPGAVDTFTADAEKVGESLEPIHYRLRCTVFTSGVIAARLSY